MCNVPSVTLQTAVLLVIKEFATSGNKFSAHDITKSIRDKCNAGQMEIPEVEDLTGADGYRFNVDHKKVRVLFNEMRDNGVFDADFSIQKKFNGMFFEYFATPTAVPTVAPTAPVPVSPTGGTPPPTSILPVVNLSVGKVDAEIQRRVEQYLANCKSRNFRPSLKNVQSAIKRGEKSTGVSSGDLADLIEKDLGYSLSYGNGIDHTQVIV